MLGLRHTHERAQTRCQGFHNNGLKGFIVVQIPHIKELTKIFPYPSFMCVDGCIRNALLSLDFQFVRANSLRLCTVHLDNVRCYYKQKITRNIESEQFSQAQAITAERLI